jgi:hypothetical protein
MLYSNSLLLSLQNALKQITRAHKNPPNVVTKHVVSNERQTSRRNKRQHQSSCSKKKGKFDVTEEKAIPSEKTGEEDSTEYEYESKTSLEETSPYNVSTSESSDKQPSLVQTSAQDRNKTLKSRILKTAGSARSQTSNHDTAGRTSSQNSS